MPLLPRPAVRKLEKTDGELSPRNRARLPGRVTPTGNEDEDTSREAAGEVSEAGDSVSGKAVRRRPGNSGRPLGDEGRRKRGRRRGRHGAASWPTARTPPFILSERRADCRVLKGRVAWCHMFERVTLRTMWRNNLKTGQGQSRETSWKLQQRVSER